MPGASRFRFVDSILCSSLLPAASRVRAASTTMSEIVALLLFAALAARPASAQLDPSAARYWPPHAPGIGLPLELGAHFGEALAVGDFDQDGFEDLAVGMPGATIGGDSTAGRVVVLYGQVGGVATVGLQVWIQDGLDDPSEPDDFFGESLAAGDFDGDGFDDLAIGVPDEDAGSFEAAGLVHVVYGSASGLEVSAGVQILSQDTFGAPDTAEPEDRFGAALVAVDLNDDGYVDLGIGVPGEDREGSPTLISLGGVMVVFGSPTGFDAGEATFYQPGTGAVELEGGSGLEFGFALAGCRFESGSEGATSTPALVVGVPGLPVDGSPMAGGVVALSGFAAAAGVSTLFVFSQGSDGVPGAAEPGDLFGASLACGDFDADGDDELAVGSPGEAIGVDAAAGAVHVLETSGIEPTHTLLHEDLYSGWSSDPGEQFGFALAVGDFDANGVADLVIGAPGEEVDGVASGAVWMLEGEAGSGVNPADFQRVPQTVDPAAVAGDRFGAALATGRFARFAATELVVGEPGNTDGQPGAGAFVVVPPGLFRDGFESGTSAAWSATTP